MKFPQTSKSIFSRKSKSATRAKNTDNPEDTHKQSRASISVSKPLFTKPISTIKKDPQADPQQDPGYSRKGIFKKKGKSPKEPRPGSGFLRRSASKMGSVLKRIFEEKPASKEAGKSSAAGQANVRASARSRTRRLEEIYEEIYGIPRNQFMSR